MKAFIQLGKTTFSLHNLYRGIGILGDHEKTSPLLQETLKQILTLFDQPQGHIPHPGGLVIDEDGSLTKTLQAAFQKSGRSEKDIVILGPNHPYKLFRPEETAESLAEKISRGLRLINKDPRGDESYWVDTTHKLAINFLQLLELHHSKNEITPILFIEAILDEEKTKALCEKSRKLLDQKKDRMEEEDYEKTIDSLQAVQECWLKLGKGKRKIYKDMVDECFHFLKDPKLQKTFCPIDTIPSSFWKSINKGKIFVFQKQNTPSHQFLTRWLITDLQNLANQRSNKTAHAKGQTPSRPILLICQNYEDYLSYEHERDATFAKNTQASKIIQLLAAHSIEALTAKRSYPTIHAFLENVGTWVFLNPTSPSTQDYIHRLKANPNEGKLEPFFTQEPPCEGMIRLRKAHAPNTPRRPSYVIFGTILLTTLLVLAIYWLGHHQK